MLSSLSQFNFSRALMLNAEVFGLSDDHMHDDACSLFVVAGPWPVSVNINTETLPHGLRPTSLQYRTEHHPWIDLLPVAQLRDNILERSVDTYDEAGLCRAFTGRGHGQGTGVIVWREPWDPSGWEVTAEFARSWAGSFQAASTSSGLPICGALKEASVLCSDPSNDKASQAHT
ncbi:uncharacterized protein FRV6_13015 [Fusarium oxysporum]|uniref:Uncharacterized protein n=1 Tax=Fusarium oxysporum TaxID=5507 RepID=A0A2H3TJY4_FUSOX|nr:uncharacterized protein FRV6_13015 [Fusarium oxysporum]